MRQMRREGFPFELQTRLRAYFHQSKHIRVARLQHELITTMPPSLQGDVTAMYRDEAVM